MPALRAFWEIGFNPAWNYTPETDAAVKATKMRSVLLQGISAESSESAKAHVWLYDNATVFSEIKRLVGSSLEPISARLKAQPSIDEVFGPMTTADWRAAKLARLLNHFGLVFTSTPSEPELVDLCLTAESKAVELLIRLEGKPRHHKSAAKPFEGHSVSDLARYVMHRMFIELEAELEKKTSTERAAFAADFAQRLQDLPPEVQDRIRTQAGVTDLSSQALMRTGAIAAVGSALVGTVGMAGFAAYTTLTSALAGVTGLIGLHLSFHAFMVATSTLAFMSNPVVLGGTLLLGGGAIARRANRQMRDRAVPTMVATAVIAGLSDGSSHSVGDVVSSFKRHAIKATADNRLRGRISAVFPCLASGAR